MDLNTAIKRNYSIDFCGRMAFVGLLELSRKFSEMKAGQILNILVRDKDTIADICKLLPSSSYQMTIKEEKNALNRIRIKKIISQ